MNLSAREWLDRIRGLRLPHKVRIMNVCGGHERTVSLSGLRSVLPPEVDIIPGPGCPVCVCPEEDIHGAIRLALDRQVILLAFGDMLRVPGNVPKGEVRSLEQARSAGADVRPIASPLEAVRIARAHPGRPVVFFAAGFETTTAPAAAMLLDSPPDNLFLLLSARRTWPAVAMLLESEQPSFDALLAPGHVATVMGRDEWLFVVEKHGLPAAVAGFTPESVLAATYSVLRQIVEGRRFLDNCYPQVVQPGGNAVAQQQLLRAMDIVDARWRGIGVIPRSGYRIRPEFAAHDARLHFSIAEDSSRRRAGQMPPGCDCAKVVLGKIYPDQCRLYGRACTPRAPVGPCMVSDEGACRIWWASRAREPALVTDRE
jgi:hydrogenase expression/formation protein HypD